ncbi:adenine phosphoribosyltransferase [Mangrovimonas aestuarii]|uniref:adenine phosphoribosyltransferase n=1 Tax=Mangrovimonas aestuarii TaxID=3018443 RepID=UPI002379A4AC|nr:adenine phosphoribosyltransferase [Mangrovimonas aestuarii]
MKDISNYIRDIADFPKPGIVFKDITPMLNDSEASQFCLEGLIKCIDGEKIDKVVGVESRGFIFGPMLAQKLNAGFVPVRKPGKLPYKTIQESYDLEYGEDVLEMHADAIKKGDKVLIHDDVLATGGTAQAVCKLVERLGGEIVQCNFILELSFLNGKDNLKPYPVKAIITY